MGKSFSTALEEHDADVKQLEYPWDFDLDDLNVPFRKMSSGESMMLAVVTSPHRPWLEKVGAVVDLFANVLHPDVHDKVIRRLMDPEDPFGPKELFGESGTGGILGYMMECWSGRPTER